jgi:hypothetical protein
MINAETFQYLRRFTNTCYPVSFPGVYPQVRGFYATLLIRGLRPNPREAKTFKTVSKEELPLWERDL